MARIALHNAHCRWPSRHGQPSRRSAMNILKIAIIGSGVLFSGAALASYATPEGNGNFSSASYAAPEGNGNFSTASYAAPEGNGNFSSASYEAPEGNGHSG